jgi:hypothetical protein
MNPIGDIKGFIIDVMINIAVVFGIGYMGGSLVSLSHLDKATLDKLLPIDLEQSPYVGEPSGITLTGYGFPYTLYTPGKPEFFVKVMNWLVITCALVFVGIRKLFRVFSLVQLTGYKKMAYDFFLFYIVPLILVSVVMYARMLTSTFILIIIFFTMFAGEFILQISKLKNGWWYGLAPLSFWFTTFFAKSEPGMMNLIIKMLLSFIAFLFGLFAMMVLYPLWWSGIVTMAIFYFTFVLFFLPLWYIDDVIKEMGNYSFSLMIILVGLTIYSSQRFLVPLFTLGVILGGIYMVYLLFKNRGKK